MPRVNTPAPPITGQVAAIVFQSATASQTCQCVFHYMAPAPVTFTAAKSLALAIAWNAAFGTLIQAVLTADTALGETLCEDVSVGIVPTQGSSTLVGLFGTVAGHAIPLEMGATLTRRANLKGQHGIGRVTMPAVPLSFQTPATDINKINAAGLLAYAALATALEGSISDGTSLYNPVIATRPIKPANVVSRAALVILMTPQALLGTARRRKPGRGI
jgi:hypothetical protein